jgi:oxygen-independent coproporphyrinogen-3 oxidase
VPVNYFAERTGLDWQKLEPQWQQLAQQELVEIVQGYARPTEMGRRFLNRVLQTFVSDTGNFQAAK